MKSRTSGTTSMQAVRQRARSLPRGFMANGRPISAAVVIETLGSLVSEARSNRIDEVVAERAQDVAVVIDGLANSGNVSAVMRTAEGLGYLRLDMIAREMPYKHSARTSQGAEKWLDAHLWDTPRQAVDALRALGYRIVATHLDARAQPIEAFDFTRKTALVFGNELGGISPEILSMADATCIIPMSGFAQSFNISVAAATGLYHARQDRIQRTGRHGDLDPAQQEWLRAAYYLRSVKEAQAILDRELES